MSPNIQPIEQPSQLPTHLQPTATRARPTRVLMADPAHYSIDYAINPYMEGNIGNVDVDLARTQWTALADIYRTLGYSVHVVPAVQGLPDLVFTANQSFPILLPDGRIRAAMSKMRSPHRQHEVSCIEHWYSSVGIETISQDEPHHYFEGMGDARWHPGKHFLYIGWGFRTSRKAIDRVASLAQCTTVALRLIDPRFYHLDTCFSPLDEHTALYVPDAFEPNGIDILNQTFRRLIPVPLPEATNGFACNGHSPDGRHFIVHPGSPITRSNLESYGYEVIEVNTSEFIKSGGSVYCMKLMVP